MQLRYEELVSAYERALQTQLRGFRPAHEFLESWVHDADPARSILSMVEAAELGGLDAVEITIGPETTTQLDRRRLEALTSKVGKVSLRETSGGLVLKVTYA